MSEYSESFHLRSKDKNDAAELLKNIGVCGIVFEPTNGWVTVIPEGELNSQISSMSSYQGTVLHYMFAEDHVWMTNLFTDGNTISSFVCAWDPELYIENEFLNTEGLSKYLVQSNSLLELESLFLLTDIEEILETNPSYIFAKLLGLVHYQWIAGHDIHDHKDEILKRNSGAELIVI